MSQKRYDLEILEIISKSNKHIRGLAKELKINPMMILRKINELKKNNIVDYKQEGRNKVYFIKKTIEAQELLYCSKHYKLTQTLKQYPILRQIFQKIKNNKKIKLAILFGSYAKNLSHKNSDIDIYIETKNRKLKKDIEQINTKLNVKIGKFDRTNILIKEIEKNNRIIKGVEIYYEKTKFFA